jgi:hypothetical protein
VLQGGWANGLSAGNELRGVNDDRVRLTITAIKSLSQSEARVHGSIPPWPGMLVEVAGWATPPARPLRVRIPHSARDASDIAALARALFDAAARRGVRWVSNPIETTPAHLLRWGNGGWELLAANGEIERPGTDAAAIAAVAKLPVGLSLFVQFPAPAALNAALTDGLTAGHQEIAVTTRADDADYILAGRYSGRRLTYAWLRPSVRNADRRKSGLPLRSEWVAPNAVAVLRDAVLRLRAIRDWQLLDSPPEGRFPYRLVLRRAGDDELPRGSIVTGEETYSLVMRAGSAMLPSHVPARYIYLFTIDSYGRSVLLFPRSGSVENRFPLVDPPDSEIALGPSGSFAIDEPYGVDTYFLLSTDEPLPNPWILEWDGVRTRDATSATPLERLLMLTASGTRAVRIVTPSTWSIERVVYESVHPPRRAPPKRRHGV